MGPRGEKEQKRSPNGAKRSTGFMKKSGFFRGPGPGPVPDLILGGFWEVFGWVLVLEMVTEIDQN